jgi:hypothetical protein
LVPGTDNTGPFRILPNPADQCSLFTERSDVRSTKRAESPNKNSAILFLALLVLFVPAIDATKAENLHALPALQQLQKNLPAASEPHSVPVAERFSAQLHKRHLSLANSKLRRNPRGFDRC